MNTHCETSDLLVFSHLRWDSDSKRPQHLLSRHAKHRRVFYFEEPIFGMTQIPRLHLRETQEGVHVVVPYLPASIDAEEMESALRDLVDELIFEEELAHYTICYYTPMALTFSRHLEPVAVIFDKMEELSLKHGIPQELIDLEMELMKKADVVYTGGLSSYEASERRHQNLHLLPSSVDYKHFSQGRENLVESEDQVNIPHPRIGFYGEIDDRLNLKMLAEMADLKPEFQFMMLGPVLIKDSSLLPQRSNIHYLGEKDYDSLPLYLAGWDCAIMPYALNDLTKYISPTETAEFLAAGKPTVSTSIADVVHPYATSNLVHIADDAPGLIVACQMAMAEKKANPMEWLASVDTFLSNNSWDIIFDKMTELETQVYAKKSVPRARTKRHIQPVSITMGRMI